MSETGFDKDITYQSRGTGIRKLSKENEYASENNKKKLGIASGGGPVNTELASV